MYGGVATPLALLHQGEPMSVRPKHQTQNRASCSRDDNGSGGNSSYSMVPRVMAMNAPRLPPLRESSSGRDGSHSGENEPLLPVNMVAKVQPAQSRTFHTNSKKITTTAENDLPPPPLPPHKNNVQVVNAQRQYTADMCYIPPWPRGPNPEAVRPQIHSNSTSSHSNDIQVHNSTFKYVQYFTYVLTNV